MYRASHNRSYKPVTEENTLKKNQYRMADSWNKKEREKKKQQNKKEKIERKKERKEYSGSRGPETAVRHRRIAGGPASDA